MRFTGRVHAEDVNAKAAEIAQRSGIEDVHAIPVGFQIKIPIADLSPEFRPPDDPERIEDETTRLEASQFSNKVKSADLSGVTLVLDAGHGGRDTGAIVDGIEEAAYVYDIACRVERLVRDAHPGPRRADGRARRALRGRGLGGGRLEPERARADHAAVPDRGRRDRRQLPLVPRQLGPAPDPPRRRAGGPDRLPVAPRRLAPPGRARHDGLRARGEVPERHATASRASRTSRAARSARLRGSASPGRERIEAEGVSRDLAERIVAAFRAAELPLHAFDPIRRNVIRGGREWVPAILRYNRIPARVLVEVCNLNNPEDRRLLQTASVPREGRRGAAWTRSCSFYGGRARDPSLRSSETSWSAAVPTPAVAIRGVVGPAYTSRRFGFRRGPRRRVHMRLRSWIAAGWSSSPRSPCMPAASRGPGLAGRKGPARRDRQERQGRAGRRAARSPCGGAGARTAART